MNFRKIVALLGLSLGLISMLDAKVYYFDFGTETSPVMDSFIGISPNTKYSEDKGYGFITKTRVKGTDRKLPEPLSQDYISSGNFRVDLRNGEYKVWIMYGDSHHGQRIWPIIKSMKVTADGKVIFEENLSKQEFYEKRYFDHLNSDYRKGENIWDKFLNVKFRKHTASIKVKDGKVVFCFYKTPLNALVVYLVKDSEEVEDELQYLEKRRKRKVIITEVKHIDENPLPTPTEKEKNQGFIIFSRHWADRIYPSTRPLVSESSQSVEIFATPGENQAGSFSLYPLKDVKELSFSVGDLKSKDGRIFNAKNIELRVMRYFEAYAGQKGSGEYKYRLIPLILYKSDGIDMELGVTKQIFINIQVPENSEKGVYEGEIKISSKAGGITNLSIKVRILPIKLEPAPILYGLYHLNYDYYYYRYWSKIWKDDEMEKMVWENEERDLKYLKKIGFNSMAFSDDMRGDITMNADKTMTFNFNGRFGKWMDLYTKLGFGPMPWYGFTCSGGSPASTSRLNSFFKVKEERFSPVWINAYVQLIKLVQDEVKKRKWSPVYIYVSDELGNYGVKGAEHGVKLLKIVKKIKGIRYVSSLNGPDEKLELPYLDIAMPNFAFPITTKNLNLIKKNKCELWLYNVGANRFSFGFYPWRTGAKGRYQWFHRSSEVNPYDDFDGSMGRDGNYNMTFPTPGGPRGTIKLEEMRAGINDMRYVATLEKLMLLRENSTDPLIKKELVNARQLLEELKKDISVDIRDYHLAKIDAKDVGGSFIRKWDSNRCEKYRWKIASQIMKLNK